MPHKYQKKKDDSLVHVCMSADGSWRLEDAIEGVYCGPTLGCNEFDFFFK